MKEPKTIYDLGYFESKEEAQSALERFSESTPITLPEHALLKKLAKELSAKPSIEAKDLLQVYQQLRENHEHTDVFCAWKDSGGKKCGGVMDIEVDAAGAFYLCKVDNKHRTPK